MDYAANAGTLIVETLIGLYLYVILLRFWMQWVRADFRNPLGQFVIAVTNPIVLPLRTLLPAIGKIDTATVVFAFIVATIKVAAILWLSGYQPDWLTLLIFGAGETLRSSIHIFIAAIILHIVASWVASGMYNPIFAVAYQIAEPLLAPARRILPPIGGIDISPILVFLFLNLSLVLLVAPISPFI
ncbi:MAG: YggT family protein [Pseudomonadota bacterium]